MPDASCHAERNAFCTPGVLRHGAAILRSRVKYRMRYNLDETKRKPSDGATRAQTERKSGLCRSSDIGTKRRTQSVAGPPRTARPAVCVATVEHAIAVCYAVLSGLPLRYDRITTLGMVLKMLVHENKLLGLNDVLQRAMSLINHYESVGDL
jgi:hypothetical protein